MTATTVQDLGTIDLTEPDRRQAVTIGSRAVVVVASNPLVGLGLARLIEVAAIPGVAKLVIPSTQRARRSGQQAGTHSERTQLNETIAVILDDAGEGIGTALRFVRRGAPMIMVSAGTHTGVDLATALASGVMWIVDPNEGFSALAHALASVVRGSPGWTVDELLTATRLGANTGPRQAPTLTPRELELIRAMQTGAANKLLAVQLGVTTKTIEAMQRVLYRKLGARNRLEAVHRFEQAAEPQGSWPSGPVV